MTHETVRLPLTVAQRGLWMSEKIAPAGTIFNLAESVEIHGAIDPHVFVAALRRVAAETDTLRLRIVDTNTGPCQEIMPDYPHDIPVIDVSAEADPRAAAEAWMWAELSARTDIARDKLWSVALFSAGDERWFWYHRAHHIAFDGYSAGLVTRRVADLYNALIAGAEPEPATFGALPDLIAHDATYRASPRFGRDRAFWLEQMADLPPAQSLARRRRQGGGGLRRRTAHVPAALSARLHEIARSIGASLPQILIALVGTYYHRATGAPDLVIGMPVTGRPGPLRNIPGMVANAVPMRLRFPEGAGFPDIVAQTGKAVLRALRHQQFRYEELRRELGLFGADQQVSWLGVNIEPFDYALEFGGSRTTVHNLSNGSVEDLMIFIYDRSDARGLRIDFDANPVLYEEADLDRHAARLLGLIDQVAAEPSIAVARLDLFAPGQREVVLRDWNDTATPLPAAPVAAAIAEAGAAAPDAPAVIAAEGSLTYRDLLARADDIAARLRGAGIGPGHLVALALPRDGDLVAAILGVMRSGAAWLPLDPDQPPRRTAAILEDARPALLLASVATAALIDTSALPVLRLDAPDDVIQPALAAPVPSVPADCAYVIFTSGSTGRPKGVVIPRPALENLCRAFAPVLGLSPRDRFLAVTTIGFDIAVLELLLPLMAGAAIILADRSTARDPAALAALIAETGVTAMQATPSLYRGLLNLAGEPLAGLALLVGGEALPPALAARLHAQARRLLNVYGPTETTIWSTCHEMDEADCAAPPIGRPIANTRVYVLDPAGQPVPPGVVGELFIGGDGVAHGYLGRAELTAQRFLPDPFAGPGARMFRTGDLARMDDRGVLECLGRCDDQVKLRGFRIELGEVEAGLLAAPGVAAAAAALRESGGEARLVGYVVPRPGESCEPGALRRAVASLLPDYMVPAAFVTLDALPLNANGKLDRAALPLPDAGETVARETGYVAPRTKGEAVLAELWAETFGLDRVSIHDNFFALGGDSLMAASMVADLAGRFSFDLPIGALFQDATIANLAPYLDGAGPPDPLAILLTLRSGSGPGVFCIHPVAGLSWGYAGLSRHLPAHTPIYGLQSIGLAQDLPTSVDEIATHYLAEIRRVQPKGPYHLVGWSFGGLIAHAMSAQLCAAGEQVKLLAMLDSYPFRRHETPVEPAEMVAASLGFLGYDETVVADVPDMDSLAQLLLRDYGIEDIPLPPSLSPPELIGRVRSVTERSLALARGFTPGHAPLDLVFLRAAQGTADAAARFLHHDPAAWESHIGGRMTVHDIPCRHQEMLAPHALEQVGRIIARAMA